MTVNYKQYESEKVAFLKKHSWIDCSTSPMDEYGRYHKEYICEDGSIWYEVMGPEMVSEVVEIKKAQVKVEVKMFRTEFWSSDDSSSKYYYEQF